MANDTAIEKRETQTMQPEPIHGGQAYIPAVDIVERPKELLLLADVPGVKPDGVNINYERGLLTVHGKVAPRQDPAATNFILQEYGVGDFYRRFEVGEGVDASRIEAELHDGVLTVHLPKAEDILPRKIAVKAS
jgi:HSP20 family protein